MEKLVTGKTTTSPTLYADLYRVFYAENWRAARIILTILSIPCFIAAAYFYEFGFGAAYTVVTLTAGIVFLVYPRRAYSRPARQMKGEVMTTRFEFYEEFMREKSGGDAREYMYKDMYLVVETPKYFFIFPNKKTASALEKTGVADGGEETLRTLLKNKCPLYKYRKK